MAFTLTVSVSVVVAPAASDATVHVIEPPENGLQVMPLERWNVVAGSIVSDTVTVPVTLLGPLFVATIV